MHRKGGRVEVTEDHQRGRLGLRVAQEGAHLGLPVDVLHGQDWVEDRLGGILFRLPATGFSQVNGGAVPAMIERVAQGRDVSKSPFSRYARA